MILHNSCLKSAAASWCEGTEEIKILHRFLTERRDGWRIILGGTRQTGHKSWKGRSGAAGVAWGKTEENEGSAHARMHLKHSSTGVQVSGCEKSFMWGDNFDFVIWMSDKAADEDWAGCVNVVTEYLLICIAVLPEVLRYPGSCKCTEFSLQLFKLSR